MDKHSQMVMRRLLGLVVLLVGVGTVFYHLVEKLSLIDSLYFTVITLSTVGYGDISPQTDIGKLFTTIYVVIGIGIFAFFINMIAKSRGEKVKDKVKKKLENNN